MSHPQTRVMQSRLKNCKEMKSWSTKTGLIQAILDKKKAREEGLEEGQQKGDEGAGGAPDVAGAGGLVAVAAAEP